MIVPTAVRRSSRPPILHKKEVITVFKKFLNDNDGLSLVEYIVGGALGALLLFTIARTIFDNVKARANGANVSLTSQIPSS